MENFTNLIKELQSSSLVSYKQLTNTGFKVFYLALDDEFYYVELERITSSKIACYYGRFYLDEIKNIKYEDTPIKRFIINYEEYAKYNKKTDKYELWSTYLIQHSCYQFSFQSKPKKDNMTY